MGSVFMSRYKIVAKLGKGGAGTTYRATNTLGVEFALKEVGDGDEAMSEAKKLVAVGEHDNVVRVYEITDEVDGRMGQPYIVMEYVHGETLAAYLERSGCLEPGLWWTLLVPILNGVHHIHANGHIHRDMKPENIVLEKKDGHWSPMIIDFGLAMKLGAMPTWFGGTPGYAPPEWNNPGLIRRSYDIYSLAVLSYHALYGDPNTDRMEMQAHLREDGDTFKSVIAKGLEENPEDRPQSIWDWIIALASPPTEESGELPGSSPSSSDEVDWGAETGRERPHTVATLRREIEEDYGLPDGCIALRRRNGTVAGGGLSTKKLRDDSSPSNYYDKDWTLKALAEDIGDRYGLIKGCVRFCDPHKTGPAVERLYQQGTRVETMFSAYGF